MFLQNLNSKPNKKVKFVNWLRWIERLMLRKGVLVDIDSCAYGKTHLVSKAQKIGGGWMFYSQGCSGCPISKLGLVSKREGKPLPRGAPNCALLFGPLFSATEVKNGKEINLPFVEEIKSKRRRRHMQTMKWPGHGPISGLALAGQIAEFAVAPTVEVEVDGVIQHVSLDYVQQMMNNPDISFNISED